jgi:hypothetical protein
MQRLTKSLCGAAAMAFVAASAQADILLYKNTFDNGDETRDAGVLGAFSGLPTEGANGNSAANAAGWAGNYGASRDGRITATEAPFSGLHLTGLADHTTITASFVLGFLESWDGYDPGTFGPDDLEIWIDGVKVQDMTAVNALGTTADFDGLPIIVDGSHDSGTEVNNNGYYSDTLIAYTRTFAHTGSTLDFEFRATGSGWQGGDDEGYGVDNVLFTYDGVHTGGIPEPATWATMIAGFGLAGASLRRRRTRAA